MSYSLVKLTALYQKMKKVDEDGVPQPQKSPVPQGTQMHISAKTSEYTIYVAF